MFVGVINKLSSVSSRKVAMILLVVAPCLVQCRAASFSAAGPKKPDAQDDLEGRAQIPNGNDATAKLPDAKPAIDTLSQPVEQPQPLPPTGDDVEVPDSEETPAASPSPIDSPSAAPSPSATPTPVDLAKLCAEKPVKFTQSLTFTDPGKTCPFSMGDNLDSRGEHIQARNEQKFDLTLPSGYVVCTSKLAIARQTINYDDQFALMLNDLVVAQTQAFPALTTKVGNYTKYEWLRLRGQPFQSSALEAKCAGLPLGDVGCEIPKSGINGYAEMKIPDATVYEMLGLAGVRTLAKQADNKEKNLKPSFVLAVFGDNDPPSDCRIKLPMKLDVEINYVVDPSVKPSPTPTPSATP